MTAYASLDQTLVNIEKASIDGDAWTSLFSFLNMCRVQALQYHHLPSPGSADYGQSDVFRHVFETANLQNNDVFENLFMALSPDKSEAITAGDTLWNYAGGTLKSITDEEGIRHENQISGVSFSVHGPLGRSGYFSLVSHDVFSDDQVRVIKWTCQNTHLALCKLKMLKLQKAINLTEREIEILSWIARGKSNSVIADILGISPHTVNTHVRRIFLKTGTNDRTSACLYGISNGLVTL